MTSIADLEMAMLEPSKSFLASLSGFFNNPAHSDAIIRCEEQDFHVHKIVLCAQSTYMNKAFSGDWKEAKEGVIELKDDDASIVRAMLSFMYQFDYSVSDDQMASTSFHIKVYSIADKYDVPSLKSQAKEKVDKALQKGWEFEDFPRAVTEIYALTPSTDRDLRDVVVRISEQNLEDLLEKDPFVRVLRETEEFGADIILHARGGTGSIKTYKCPSCHETWKASLPPSGGSHCMRCSRHRSDWERYVQRAHP